MKKTEITEIYNILSEKEFRIFGEYVHTPYFGVPERIIKLYDLLNSKKEDVITGKLSRKDIAAGILKAGSTDANTRKLFSDLNKETESFLKLEYCKKNKLAGEITLIQHFRETGNYAKAKLLAGALLKEISKQPPSEGTYRLMADIDSELNMMEESSDFHKYSRVLQTESDTLDAYYITRKLYLFQLMYSKEKLNSFSGTKYSANMLGGILEYIEENRKDIKKKYPDIFLKYLMLKMLGAANEEMILEYREYLDSESNRLSREQRAEFYSDLYNYLTIRIADGDHKFRKPLLALYKHLEKLDLLYDSGKGKIHLYTYKQVLDTAIHLKDLAWAEYFAGKFQTAIDDLNRKNIVNLEYAKIYYYKGDTNRSRTHLAKVDYRDFIHYLDSKMFLVCIEYDDKNFAVVMQVIDSIGKFILKHSSLPHEHTLAVKNFSYYVKALIKINEKDNDAFDIVRLKSIFNNDKKTVYAREWINDKLLEISAEK